ncbi:hypothetical protein C8J56DRAFT_1169294 [Mycena floridula]|nr:hypothetical protein C8J56DRAFT_1169294 [Mycena floridula]
MTTTRHFPGVDVTCRSCRAEWLYVKAREHKGDAEALGLRTRNTLQPVFGATDYETRSVVESFIELGEGTIRDVITIARDRQWLNKHTKLRDMLNQAALASRFESVDQLDNHIPSSNQLSSSNQISFASSIPSNRPLEEEEDSEEEEDADFLHMTENDGVGDLALMDWARLRILDGFWMNWPFYRHRLGSTVACALRAGFHGASESDGDDFAACDAKCRPENRLEVNDGLRDDVEEAGMQESGAARLAPMDPVIKAARMSPEDVVIALRDEGIWFEGVDWVERRRNETRTREANETRTREANETTKGQGSDSSTNSSTSTSPVLSTTTLQTTSSPPAIDTSKPTISRNSGPILSESASSRSIPSESSRIISPESVKHLPQFSLQAFKSVWREACAPLYHCRCSICERAQTKLNEANAAASNAAGTENADPIQVDAIDNATKGIQVIPDRLSSPPLVEIEIGSPGGEEIGLEDGEKPLYEQDERKSRSSTFVARRLGEPGPPAGRLVPGREGRNLPSSRTLPASRTLPSRGTSPSRTRPPSRTLPSRDRHPLAQEEEEEELGEFDDYELDDYGTGEYEDYGSDFDSEYSDTPSRRRSISPKRQRSLSPIRHRSRSPSASRRFSRSISPLSTRSLSASERPRRAQTPAFSKTPPSSASRRASPRRILGPSTASLGPSRASPELEISSRPQTPISRKRACEDAPVTPPKRARHERSLSGSASPKGISGLESPKESFGEELSALKGASESSSTSQTPRKRSSEELDDALLGVKKRIRMSENVQPAT